MSRKQIVIPEMKALVDAFIVLGKAMNDFGRDKRLRIVIGRKALNIAVRNKMLNAHQRVSDKHYIQTMRKIGLTV